VAVPEDHGVCFNFATWNRRAEEEKDGEEESWRRKQVFLWLQLQAAG